MKKRKNKVIILILIIAIILFFFSLYHIIIWEIDNKKTNEQIEDLQDIVKIGESKDSITTEKLDYSKYRDIPLLRVDFTNLLAINKETKGWLQIPNTNIDYPFVQHKDNTYYLSHSFDQTYNSAGWLFLDARNKIDTLDTNTIIYAHGRVDGTMFGSLKDILTDNFKAKDQFYIKVSTLNYNYLFEIFSAYHIPTTNDYLKNNFNSDIEYQEFLDKIQNRSMVLFDTLVTTKNKILTLSTCYNNKEKMVVHAKLIKQEKRY